MGAENEVTPWVTMGWYDQNDCWHPFYYDDQGHRVEGWGWFDDEGIWCVAQGHYEPDGTWIDSADGATPGAGSIEVADVEVRMDEDLSVGLRHDELPRWVGTSAVSHGIFLLLAFTMPDAASTLELDAHGAQDRFVQMTLTDQQKEEKPESGASKATEETTAAANHSGQEGRAGDVDEAETKRRLAIRGPAQNEDQEIARARNREIASGAGIAREVASMWATSDRSLGSDALHALGAIDGSSEPGGAKGAFGLGITGKHPGGGGKIADSIGMGDVDTKGILGINGSCKGLQCGNGADADLGEKGTGVPKAVVIPQPFKFTGGLDREIIRRIVRQHNRELKACYEAELQKNKRLGGELVVKFTITGAGNVVAAVKDGGSLDNASIERCVTSRIRRWVFPEQDGMGVVVVRYPFRFSAGH